MWAQVHNALADLMAADCPAAPVQHQKDQLQVFHGLATFYLKYLQIFRSLEVMYDQLVHPQKRRIVRQVLDGVMGRLLELKNEMVELELSEFHYFDDVLQDLKMTPQDLEIPIPRYFLREKMQVLREREKMLAHILAKGGLTKQNPNKSVQTMCLEEAVGILHVCERARQGRLRAKFMKEIRQAQREVLAKFRAAHSTTTPDQAAILIQKVWRGYSQRKRTERERLEELIFLGMVPAVQPSPSPTQLKARQVETGRRLVQEQNEAEYQKALLSVKDSIWDVEGPDMRETLQEQIRQWFIECRDATGKFPDFPNPEDGGSALIFAQKTPEQVALELAAREAEKQKKKKKNENNDAKKEKNGGKTRKIEKKIKQLKAKEKDDVEDEEAGWKMAPSNFIPTVMEGDKMYRDVWQGRDERQNLLQRCDLQLVREEKRQEVEEEVRVQVDELMRQELKNLRLAVDRNRGDKKKKPKGNKKKKKSKKSTKKKKKKAKDLTADRSIESLYEELILQGLLIQPMNIKLSDYIGEFSYLGTTLRQAHIEPMPSLSDVRQLIALYGVLPLGSQSVHERAPAVKSLLLAGPSGVGKKMLVHALCSETGANLFNLSPGNLAGKYPGRAGLQYLLHLVLKVARQLQPSVIWIEDAEKTFYKKVPKTDKEMEPRRLKKDLFKVVKALRPEDRVLLVGTSRRPFDADIKSLCKVYRKIILLPRPDYASRLVLWRELLLRSGAEPGPRLDLSSLAKVTDGYTQGHILTAVRQVLSGWRLAGLRAAPLTAAEFVPPLARLEPVFKEEEEAFKMWCSRTPLGRRRARAARAAEEEADQGKREDKKGAGPRRSKEDKSTTKRKPH